MKIETQTEDVVGVAYRNIVELELGVHGHDSDWK